MTTIHVEPEQIHQAALCAWQKSLLMNEDFYRLRISLIRLQMAWQGPTAEQFCSEAEGIIRQIQNNIEQLDQMGWVLYRQAEQWDYSDMVWFANYRDCESTLEIQV